MLQFLFDTDHVTLYQRGHPLLCQRVGVQSPGVVGISAISAQEAMRGRLGALSRCRDGLARILNYRLLVETIQLFNRFSMVTYDQPSEDQFQLLLAMRLRIGTQDLKIAAVALANSLILLTRNRSDFALIPGLGLADWST